MYFLLRFNANFCLPLKTGMYSAVTHNYMYCSHEKPILATRIIRINGNQVLAEHTIPKNSETDIKVQPENQKSKVAWYWLLP